MQRKIADCSMINAEDGAAVRAIPGPTCWFMCLAISLVGLPPNMLNAKTQDGDRSPQLEQKAIRLLEKAPLVDGHNDLAEKIRAQYGNHLSKIDISRSTKDIRTVAPFQTDIPRLRQGHVGGVFFAAFVPPEIQGTAGVPYLFEQIDVIRRIATDYSNDFALALTASDVERVHKSGKIAILIGIENGAAIDNSLAVLRQAFNCGARYLTLTHGRTTDWADASNWDAYSTNQGIHGGLSPFGREVVREMNRLGMMVDLSHVSDSTAIGALKTSVAPVIFSHSCARALCNHPRNVPDDILLLLKENDGVIMLCFYPQFISEEVRIGFIPADLEWNRLSNLYANDPKRAEDEYYAWYSHRLFPKATISQLADQIDHIKKVAGIDHIGIGSDFEGIEDTPIGLEDVSDYPKLFIELMKRNYSSEEIMKIAGGNVLRVMRSVEQVASQLQRERPASEALIEELDGPKPPKQQKKSEGE
jgi:membrane dipeptidase